MRKRLTLFILLAVLAPLALAQQASTPPAQALPKLDAGAVEAEVRSFYTDYWSAWEQRDARRILDALAPEFVHILYQAPQGVVQADKAAAEASVRQFIDAIRGRNTLWNRNLLSVMVRSSTDAVAAVRNEFALAGGDGGEVELTLEMLRKGPDGHWRLVRKWSEKGPF